MWFWYKVEKRVNTAGEIEAMTVCHVGQGTHIQLWVAIPEEFARNVTSIPGIGVTQNAGPSKSSKKSNGTNGIGQCNIDTL